MQTSTLLYNRIDRVKVTPTGNVPLPKLKPLPLPTIEGEVQEYASFRELFTIHVDRRADLDDVSKFTYLLGTLGRDPLRIVKSLSVTAANYRIVLDLLDKQYGNVHQTLVILHRKLANIFIPSFNPVELKRFRFELTIIIEQIKRLSSNDIGHGMVMSIINQKLSEGKLYRKVVEHLRKCDYTLDEFFDAIDFIIRMVEDDALTRGDKLEPDKRINVSVRAKSKPVQKNSCPFCNERHPPHRCRRVTDMAARRCILLKRGLCFNCINSGHRSDKCPVHSSCKNCSGNHNTAICDNYNPEKRLQSVPSTSASSNSSSQSTTSRPVVNATPQQHETAPRPSKDKVEPKQWKSAKIAQMSSVDLPCTILPTAMAKINHKQGSKRVRLFLDTGRQKSFIFAKIARQLGLPVVRKVALNIAPFGSAEISGQYDVISCRIEIGRRVERMKLVAHENVDVPMHNAGYVQVRQHLLSKGVTLADPENKSYELKNVHILVGADYFSYFIIGIEKVDGKSLFLTNNGMSPYGKVPQWLLQGKKIEHVKTLRVCRIESEPNQFDVDEWWRLDRGMNKLTIPKLELLALLLGCRLAKTLKGLIEPREIVMWTDSKVTLACVASPDAKDNKNVFISNRVAEIIFLHRVCDFSPSYVPSKQNPADVLSRGATTQQLLQNPLWQNDPEFLRTAGEPVPYKEDDPTNERTVVAAVQEMREEIRSAPPGEIWEILQKELESQFLRVTRLLMRFTKLKRHPFKMLVAGPTFHCQANCTEVSRMRASLPAPVETATTPPPIPKERINLTKPFTAVGVDHRAAIQTETRPDYILIVTCMASRAVYLDFCPSLEVEEFVLALRRFCATHGAPSFITSDNHQTFKTISNLLQGLRKRMKSSSS
ncbi:uncharacterized protein [Palaemon carinicauda]|uniref:uncharacterized protein n=1 Tax=Palaemon carinicauda TaxID=392227 RepID=UPI0035B69D0E